MSKNALTMVGIPKGSRKKRWWPFVLLCVLTLARWTSAERWNIGSTGLSEAIGCGSACVLVLTLATRRRVIRPQSRLLLEAAISGAWMLVGPFLATFVRGVWTDEASLTMALALVPVVVAVARPAFRSTEGANLAGRLWPGIAAIAALLLLLPEPSLSNTRRDIVLVAIPLATGLGAAWFRAREGDRIWRASMALGGAALLFTIAAVSQGAGHWQGIWFPALLDGLLALLSVLAVLRLGATRWSGQFVLLPLAAVVEGLLMMHAKVDLRYAVGIGLLLLATIFLLLPPKAEEPGALGLQEAE